MLMIKNKHKLIRIWQKLKLWSLLLLILLFFLSAVICVTALRDNNLKMVVLRQKVFTADENNIDINESLNNLRKFVYSHMNTRLKIGNGSEKPIQLTHSYDRAVDYAQSQAIAAGAGQANKVYTEAQKQCEQAKLLITERVTCIQNYVTSHAGGITQINLPPKEAYIFDFISPAWSPDLAGYSLLMTIIFGVLLIIRLLVGIVLKYFV